MPLWFRAEVLTGWQNSARTGQRGQPRTYTATAIETRAPRQEIDPLGLRQTEGLRQSRGALLRLAVASPDYATLSRRRATLAMVLPRTPGPEALPVGVASTGVKGGGEGEWRVRQHGYT